MNLKNLKIKVTDASEMSQAEINKVKKIQLKKLKQYKDKGLSKERIIEMRIFPKSFIEKYY